MSQMKGLLRAVITIAGIALGPGLVVLVYTLIQRLGGEDPNQTALPIANLLIFIVSGIITGIIFFFLPKS